MDIILHRVNSIKDLERANNYGIEVDVRYHDNELILSHDPFHNSKDVDKLENVVEKYINKNNGIIILNVKTEGIEERCIELMNKFNYSNWFFLDISMPYFIKYSNISNNSIIKNFTPNNLAVRFSEFEPIEYALSFKDKVRWVWIDCFKNLPLNIECYEKLKLANFKLCLVAPELQKHDVERTKEFQDIIKKNNFIIDAVCTKNPNLWKI